MGKGLDYAQQVLGGIVFVIELVTFSLFFFEEGYVNLLRAYRRPLLDRNKSALMVFDYNDFDFMMSWGLSFLGHFGKLAVYSYKAFVTFFYMCMMWRSYSAYVRTGERGEQSIIPYEDGSVMVWDNNDWDLYMRKVWDGRINKK
jgi:hypothetical protein